MALTSCALYFTSFALSRNTITDSTLSHGRLQILAKTITQLEEEDIAAGHLYNLYFAGGVSWLLVLFLTSLLLAKPLQLGRVTALGPTGALYALLCLQCLLAPEVS